MEYLDSLRLTFPELEAQILEVREASQRALWHEFTVCLEKLIKSIHPSGESALLPLFEKVILPVAKKLNPIALIRIGVACLLTVSDLSRGRALLSSLDSFVKEKNAEAFIYLRCEESGWALKQKELKEAEDILEECKKYILSHEAQDINQEVQACYYAAQSRYFKSTKKYDDLYSSGLLHLAYADLEHLTVECKQQWALDIGTAALLSSRVYNFGELLGNPVMSALVGSKFEPFHALLNAFNKGDIPAFERVFNQEKVFKEFPELQQKANFLQEKMQIMAFLNYVFSLAVQNMTVSFSTISERTRLGADMVEYMILKTLALGLIKGVIDQVAQTVCISWVQARVLEREEMKAIVQKLSSWSGNVKHTLDLVATTNSSLQALQ